MGKRRKFFSSLRKSSKRKAKGPSGLEVTTTGGSGPAASTSAGEGGGRDEQGGRDDAVSAITPVTGLPPDDPSVRPPELPPLRPPPPRQPAPSARVLGDGAIGGALYPGPSSSPRSSPSRGGMNIRVPLGGTDRPEDDISVMTPVTGVPGTPQKAAATGGAGNGTGRRQRLAPPPQPLLFDDDDDDRSRELTVYEENLGADDSFERRLGSVALSPQVRGSLTSNSNSKPSSTSKPLPRRQKQKLGAAASKLVSKRTSWLTRTEYFQKAIESSFQTIDVDKSGDVTLEELHAGLLLVHLKMAVYVGAPACRPASKEYVTEIFHLLDADDSGTLTKEEFAAVMKILYSQVFTRIVIHWLITLMIVPIVSQNVIDFVHDAYVVAAGFLRDIDDDLDPIQRFLWRIWTLFLAVTPSWMDRAGATVAAGFGKVPIGVWKRMPYTMLTLAQTSVALPFALNRVENFFRRMARSDHKKKKEKEQ